MNMLDPRYDMPTCIKTFITHCLISSYFVGSLLISVLQLKHLSLKQTFGHQEPQKVF